MDCAEIRRWAAVEVIIGGGAAAAAVIGDALENSHHFKPGKVDLVDVGAEKCHGTHQELGNLRNHTGASCL